MREQLQQVTENYESAIHRLENPEGSLEDSNDVLNTVTTRAEAAEEEVKKYKSGKAAQDGRIKDLREVIEHHESAMRSSGESRRRSQRQQQNGRHLDRPSSAVVPSTHGQSSKGHDLGKTSHHFSSNGYIHTRNGPSWIVL